MKQKDKIDSLAGSSSLSDQRKQFQKLYIVTALLCISSVNGIFSPKISQIHCIFEFLSAPLNYVFLTILNLVHFYPDSYIFTYCSLPFS